MNPDVVELPEPRSARLPLWFGLAMSAAVLAGLAWLKWPAALSVLAKARLTHAFLPKPEVFSSAGLPAWEAPFARAAGYLVTVWKALAFGVLLSAALEAFLPRRWLVRLAGDGSVKHHIAAGVAGSPLMLCSCCAAPVAVGVYETTGQVGPSLAVLLGSPSLNPAALALTFVLFSPAVAFGRLAMALLAVFVAAYAVARLGVPGRPAPLPAEGPPDSVGAALVRYAKALRRVSLQTLPLIVLGALASALFAHKLGAPLAGGVGAAGAAVLTALVAVPVALPTFFEIPMGLVLLASGAPAGAVAALLFAGPAVNLPSLLTLGKSAGWRVALGLAAAVFAVAAVGGVVVGLLA